MQTFLPYPDFWKSAHVLDRQRLGKQRLEAWQIYQTLTGKSTGWENHPAVKMWKGYEIALLYYAAAMCWEWLDRGYKDSMFVKIALEMGNLASKTKDGIVWTDSYNPPWLGNKKFHESHRSNLLRKMPKHYRKYWPKLTNKLPYVWPK